MLSSEDLLSTESYELDVRVEYEKEVCAGNCFLVLRRKN